MSDNKLDKIREGSKDALKAVYYVIIGLAITEALNRTFVKNNSFIGLDVFSLDRLPCTILLVALMPTICRFVHGASLHLDMSSERSYKPLFDFVSFFIQGSFFYVMAITLDKPLSFLILFITMLTLDATWLLILKKIKYIKFDSTEKQWLWSDVFMVVLFFGLVCTYSAIPCIASVAIITTIAILASLIDYYMNRDFYFPK